MIVLYRTGFGIINILLTIPKYFNMIEDSFLF